MKKQKKKSENQDIFSMLAGTMDFFIKDMKEIDSAKYKSYIKTAERMKRNLKDSSNQLKIVSN